METWGQTQGHGLLNSKDLHAMFGRVRGPQTLRYLLPAGRPDQRLTFLMGSDELGLVFLKRSIQVPGELFPPGVPSLHGFALAFPSLFGPVADFALTEEAQRRVGGPARQYVG